MVWCFPRFFLHFFCFCRISYSHPHSAQICVLCVSVPCLVHSALCYWATSWAVRLVAFQFPSSQPPLLITPALRYLWMSEITLPTLMVRDNTSMSLLWHTVIKNFSKSISTTYTYPLVTLSGIMSHYAGCIFFFVEINKSFNRKVQKIVTSKNKDSIFTYIFICTCQKQV